MVSSQHHSTRGRSELDRRAEGNGRRTRHPGSMAAWADWNADSAPWTVGLEEEVMLLDPDGSPAWRSEDVLRELPPDLAEHTRGETHGLALELATTPHTTVAGGAGRDRARARAPRRGRGHASDGARRGGRGLARRALPVPAREPARAGPARADVRAARARRG